jgi:hypothetical protein
MYWLRLCTYLHVNCNMHVSMQVRTMIQCIDKRSHNYIICKYDYLNVTPRAKAAQGH